MRSLRPRSWWVEKIAHTLAKSVQIVMVVQVFPPGKPKSIWIARVNVAVQLKEQQQGTSKHQSTIGDPRERPEIFDVLANNGQKPCHAEQTNDLTELDTDVEGQQAGHQPGLWKRQVLHARCKPKAVNKTEGEHHKEEVGGTHANCALEPVEIVETLVDDRHGDHGIDQVGVGLPSNECRSEKSDAVTQRERGNEANDVAPLGQEEHDAEQKEQMVVARQHVEGADLGVFEMTAC